MNISNRGLEFKRFSLFVVDHVEKYTVPQYGDSPDDMVSTWTAEHVQQQMEKYLKRMGNNGRGVGDDILSCLKIAHYAGILHAKLLEQK